MCIVTLHPTYGNGMQTYIIQQAYSWSKAFNSYQTNCASSYEASEVIFSQEDKKNMLRLTDTKSNSDRYFQQIQNRNDMTGVKGCWRRCRAPSTMSSSGRHSGSSFQQAEWWTACMWYSSRFCPHRHCLIGLDRGEFQGEPASLHQNVGRKSVLWIIKSFWNRYVFTRDGGPSHTSNLLT